MKTTRFLLAAALAATPVLAQPQFEVVLYSGSSFTGRTLSLRHDTANFEPLGFNDRTSSIRVVRGTWELCDDSYYRGNCRIYGRGEYRDLRSQENRISSARLVVTSAPGSEHGSHPAPGAGWVHVGRGDVALYSERDFHGYITALTVPTRNFEPLGFNDRVDSIVVRRGVWEFCTDSEFRGECRVYGPGQYASLGRAHGAYSSARPIQGMAGAQPESKRPRIALYDGPDFSGRTVALDSALANFERVGFNDRVESVIVEKGRWKLCSDADGRGKCREFGPGKHKLLPPDLNGRVSSAYPQ